jgi:D-arabinitol 4-dehydrogenase
MQALRDALDTRWSLVSANIRPDMTEVLDALRAQGGHYTLETISPEGSVQYKRIESIQEVLPYEPDLASVIALGSDPDTRIISFTVTEAGYYLDAMHRLDLAFDDLAADIDLARRGEPGHTIYGAVCSILRARRAAEAGPLTLLSSDNLRHNGERFRGGLLEFIERTGDLSLHEWVKVHTSSPNAMVDGITPRPPLELRARVRAATGWDDAAPVTAERFVQWVIEDDFIAGRPAWETVGVELVDSVQPYEEAKIRLLNATHSCIAWAGTLIGLQFIHEGTHKAAIRQMAYDYVTDNVIPVLSTPDAPSPVDLPAYRDTVIDRFGNSGIRDTNQRVVADSFSKIPGFITPTVRERLERGMSIDAVAMLPALFLAFLQRWHRGELPYVYQDQSMNPEVAHMICNADDPVAALCNDTTLWGEQAGNPQLIDAVRRAGARVADFVTTG